MKIGLDNDNTIKNETSAADGLADLVKEQSSGEKTKFSDLDRKKKAEYIWDYYKWWFIVGIIAIILAVIFVRDYRENSKPTYLYAEMLNTYFGYDNTNTLYQDYVEEEDVDLSKEHVTIGMDTTLSVDNFDTTMLAFQQRLMANYAAQAIDVVIGPVDIIEGPANCDAYANLDEILPQDLKDELIDKEYEFWYFDPSKDEVVDYEGEDLTPYIAGVYLDNCSYLNNMGEHGAYPVATKEGERPVFTIAANSLRTDHAVGFLRFLIK